MVANAESQIAFHTSRHSMIDGQLRVRGITDRRTLAAMAAVPRELFVPPSLVTAAYDDRPLPIAEGQTISQPYIVALMTEALQLQPADRVLEIGAGTGYSAAILSLVASEVFTVERLPSLARAARERLATLGYARIHVQCSDGSLGWREHAPYQGIVVTAAGPSIPRSLVEQLDVGGRLVMPVGSDDAQMLVRLTRGGGDRFTLTELCAVEFVPLIGEEGWPDDDQVPCTD